MHEVRKKMDSQSKGRRERCVYNRIKVMTAAIKIRIRAGEPAIPAILLFRDCRSVVSGSPTTVKVRKLLYLPTYIPTNLGRLGTYIPNLGQFLPNPTSAMIK